MSRKLVNSRIFTAVYSNDEKGEGGAKHDYTIVSNETHNVNETPKVFANIQFQNGAILESGINGCQNEDLIEIVLDRLRDFQNGKFPCRENAIAITKLEEALMWLDKRTLDRKERDVDKHCVKVVIFMH